MGLSLAAKIFLHGLGLGFLAIALICARLCFDYVREAGLGNESAYQLIGGAFLIGLPSLAPLFLFVGFIIYYRSSFNVMEKFVLAFEIASLPLAMGLAFRVYPAL